MRITRWLPIALVLSLAGCILTSGQFAISFDLGNLVVSSPNSIIPVPVDLNTISDYNEHKDELKDLADLALLGEITNNSSTTSLDVEFWMTPALTTIISADAVRADPTAVRLWGPLTLAPSEVLRIEWDHSAGLFEGKQALLNEVTGDGVFTLYALGTGGAVTYSFTLRQGVLVVVLDAGV